MSEKHHLKSNDQLPWKMNQFNSLDLFTFGLKEIPLVGIYNLYQSKSALRTHQHPGLMEISYLAGGQLNFHVEGKNHLLTQDDIFITQPDEPHSNGNHPYERNSLFWIQLQLPQPGECFLGLGPQESTWLSHELSQLPHRQFRGNSKFKTSIESIFWTASQNHSPRFKRLKMAQTIIDLLLQCLEWANIDQKQDKILSEDIRRVADYINRHVREAPNLEKYAELSTLSLSRFKVKFKSQMGVGPAEYCLQMKVNYAAERLKSSNESITALAHDLGFSSSQYFATVFKRFKNMSPREYVQNI